MRFWFSSWTREGAAPPDGYMYYCYACFQLEHASKKRAGHEFTALNVAPAIPLAVPLLVTQPQPPASAPESRGGKGRSAAAPAPAPPTEVIPAAPGTLACLGCGRAGTRYCFGIDVAAAALARSGARSISDLFDSLFSVAKAEARIAARNTFGIGKTADEAVSAAVDAVVGIDMKQFRALVFDSLGENSLPQVVPAITSLCFLNLFFVTLNLN